MQSLMFWKECRLISYCLSVSTTANGKVSAEVQKSNGSKIQPMMPVRIVGNQVMAKRILRSISFLTLTLLAVVVAAPTVLAADETGEAASAHTETSAGKRFDQDPMNGPDSVSVELKNDKEEKADVLDLNLLKKWKKWKAGITEKTGLDFGADYTAVGFAATSSLGDDTSASGIARVYGSWAFLNRGTKDTGSIDFKIENRHSYTDVPPAAFGFEVGYVGTPEPVFNDQGFRVNNLYWKQHFFDDRAGSRLGFIDVKEYFDVYALASPWTGFGNLAFSIGSNTMTVLPDGAFGAMVGVYLTDRIYAAAGIADRNADPTDVFHGFDTFFNDFETFKSFEIGITGGGRELFLRNVHVAIWQMDESDETGAPGGWGVTASASTVYDGKWLPFLRGAWAHDGGGAYEASISAGLGYMNKPGGNLLGIGLNWGRPNSDTFPVDLNDQFTGEVFYRVQLAENIQVTPSIQLYGDPALNPDVDFIVLFGLRARVQF